MTVATLSRIRPGAVAALLVLTVLAPVPAWSAACPLPDPEAGDPCTIGAGPLRLRLGSGQYSFDGSTQMNGSDGFVNGYTGGTHAVPAFELLDLGSGRFGFAFAPGMNGEVGFNRFLGYHEISAHFAFSDIAFAADAGWEVVSIDFGVEGTVRRAGMAALFLHLPGSPVYRGDSFVAIGALQPGTTGFGAGFSASVSFEEDADGNPAGEGDARVSLDRVRSCGRSGRCRSRPRWRCCSRLAWRAASRCGAAADAEHQGADRRSPAGGRAWPACPSRADRRVRTPTVSDSPPRRGACANPLGPGVPAALPRSYLAPG